MSADAYDINRLRLLDDFLNVEVAIAQNWLRWAHDVFSEEYMRRHAVLLKQRDEARGLIAEKCAAWFEVTDVWHCPLCAREYYAAGECDWHAVKLLPLGVYP